MKTANEWAKEAWDHVCAAPTFSAGRCDLRNLIQQAMDQARAEGFKSGVEAAALHCDKVAKSADDSAKAAWNMSAKVSYAEQSRDCQLLAKAIRALKDNGSGNG